MNKLLSKKSNLPEVIVSNNLIKKTIYSMCSSGALNKIGSKLYTTNLKDSPESIVKRNLWQIVGQYFPSGVLACRTAIENKPAIDNTGIYSYIYIISKKTRKIVLPGGFVIIPVNGSPALESDMPFIGGIYIPSLARAFLENLKPSRTKEAKIRKNLSTQEIEERLFDILIKNGDLNFIRDKAKLLAPKLGLMQELVKLEKIIGTLLGTKSHRLESKIGRAVQELRPFDQKRVDLFKKLHEFLYNLAPFSRISKLKTKAWQNLSFFEGYFSNFIEGTEFEVEEAVDIAFNNKIPLSRPEDAHDILGTYHIVSSVDEMSKTPGDFEEFLFLLKERHKIIMGGRSSCMPGEFKDRTNRAGGTLFVDPKLVVGTLKAGFDLYRSIECPFYKALFVKFIVAEVHPFLDGNGRLSRIMMNAELVANNEMKIIIPTIYRSNYLSALKALSQNGIIEPLLRTLDFAQRYTQHIDWSDFGEAKEMLTKSNAFMDSRDADQIGTRLIIL